MGWPGPMTRLQYLAWHAWLALDLESPDRHDLYVMQLTQEVAAAPLRVWGKDLQLPLERWRLRFRETDAAEAPVRCGPTAAAQGSDDSRPDAMSSEPEGTALAASSQEAVRGVPRVVTQANRAALEAKIAVAFKLVQAGKPVPVAPVPPPPVPKGVS